MVRSSPLLSMEGAAAPIVDAAMEEAVMRRRQEGHIFIDLIS
jgi:hypothetical protein